MSGHAAHALRLQSLAAFRPRATNASRLLNARALSGSNPQPPFLIIKRAPNGTLLSIRTGGELGIRTPDALLGHTRLAGEHLRPLGQLSVTAVL